MGLHIIGHIIGHIIIELDMFGLHIIMGLHIIEFPIIGPHSPPYLLKTDLNGQEPEDPLIPILPPNPFIIPIIGPIWPIDGIPHYLPIPLLPPIIPIQGIICLILFIDLRNLLILCPPNLLCLLECDLELEELEDELELELEL